MTPGYVSFKLLHCFSQNLFVGSNKIFQIVSRTAMSHLSSSTSISTISLVCNDLLKDKTYRII